MKVEFYRIEREEGVTMRAYMQKYKKWVRERRMVGGGEIENVCEINVYSLISVNR